MTQDPTPHDPQLVEAQRTETLPVPIDPPVETSVPVSMQDGITLLAPEQMVVALERYTECRTTFRDWLRSQMTEGVHYGTPPGCEPDRNVDPKQWTYKPSLYKAGADMICDLLKMRPTFEADAVAWEQMGSKQGLAVFVCRLVSRISGEILGEGRGAASDKEKRRNQNAAIKVAQKCAKVDAVINTLGLSDLFTQDMEDQPRKGGQPDQDADAPRAAPRGERQDESRVSDILRRWKRWKDTNDAEKIKASIAQALGLDGPDALPASADLTAEQLDKLVMVLEENKA